MKRAGHLTEKAAELNNLYLAFHKAQKGKLHKPNIYGYSKNLDKNLQTLREQLLSGNVETGNYHYFTIYDPKQRTICAAPFGQRVMHHALMNVCHEYFEKHQVSGSYASRIGKGTYAAIDRAKASCRQNKWFLKLDVRKYFDSIDHTVLKEQLSSLFKDRVLLKIFDSIIDSYATEPGKGVPIGNLTSQYFANHYLSAADHFVKEQLRIKHYIRYMDDMVLFNNSKEILLSTGKQFSEHVGKQLQLSLKPFCLNRTVSGLPFLGYRIAGDRVRLSPRSKKRFIEKSVKYYELLQSGIWSQKEYQEHITPLTAFTEHADTRGFRKKVYEGIA